MAADSPTLLLFIAKDCPCSAASLAGLERLLGSVRSPINAVVVASGPGPSPWGPSTPPGVRSFDDAQGEETARFGVATSGLTLLFDTGGRRLLFRGGLTPARGHEGDSVGLEAILDHVGGLDTATCKAPVYGCSVPGRRPGGRRRG